jgi:hypothetical protein
MARKIGKNLTAEFAAHMGRDWLLNVKDNGKLVATCPLAWEDQMGFGLTADGRKYPDTLKLWFKSEKNYQEYLERGDTIAVLAVSEVPDDSVLPRKTKDFIRVYRVDATAGLQTDTRRNELFTVAKITGAY